MAETYALKIRRFDPESGEPAYWQEFNVELEPERSVLDGILQVRGDQDGSLAIRCSCQAAICGSCGGEDQRPLAAGVQHADRGSRGAARRTARSSSSRWATCPC